MATETYFTQLWLELKQILKLMLLTVPTQVLITLPSVICYMLAGHVSNEDFDAVGLGLSFLNAVAFSTSNGMAMACEVFLSQANGSSKRSSLGLVVQRCLIITSLLFCIVGTVVVHFHSILKLFGKSELFITNVQHFLLSSLPGLLGFSVMMIEIKYLQCQKIVKPCVIIGFIANIVHIGYALPLTIWSGLGVTGTGLSLSITYWIWSFLLYVYIRQNKVLSDTWTPWSSESLRNWKSILKTAIPCIVMVCLELVCLEIFTVLTAILGQHYLSIFLIPINIFYIAYNMEYGGATAVTIQIGNYLGNGDSKSAKFSAMTSQFLALGVAFIDSVFIISLHYVIPFLYSSDQVIIQESRPLIILIAVTHFFDAIFYINGGIVRACNRQVFLTLIDLGVFGFIGIPLAFCLIFLTTYNVYGIIIALLVSLFLLAGMVVLRVQFFNWEQEAIFSAELVTDTTSQGIQTKQEDIRSITESSPFINDAENRTKFVLRSILIFGSFVTLFSASLISSFLY